MARGVLEETLRRHGEELRPIARAVVVQQADFVPLGLADQSQVFRLGDPIPRLLCRRSASGGEPLTWPSRPSM